MTAAKVTPREQAAAQLLRELDRRAGRITDPRVDAIADARWPARASEVAISDGAVLTAEAPLVPTPEERAALELIGRGVPAVEIAETLGVTESTARIRSDAILALLRQEPIRPATKV